MRRKRKNISDENPLDLTPMMDIVFIMLIFFIVTTSFVKETGVDISEQKQETHQEQIKHHHKPKISRQKAVAILARVCRVSCRHHV